MNPLCKYREEKIPASSSYQKKKKNKNKERSP